MGKTTLPFTDEVFLKFDKVVLGCNFCKKIGFGCDDKSLVAQFVTVVSSKMSTR